MTNQQKDSKRRQSKNARDLAKYSGLGFQMLVIIGLGAFLGRYLDQKFETGNLLTAFSTLVFIFISFYIVFKEISKR